MDTRAHLWHLLLKHILGKDYDTETCLEEVGTEQSRVLLSLSSEFSFIRSSVSLQMFEFSDMKMENDDLDLPIFFCSF